MQNKGFVKIFAVLLTLVCLFYLSFTFVTRYHAGKAEECVKGAEFYKDSVKNESVWLGIYTLQQCEELEIGLGLDLQGGLSVIMEVSVPDLLKTLSGDKQDSAFVASVETLRQQMNMNDGVKDPIGSFIETYGRISGGEKLATIFATAELRDKVTQNSTDSEVEAVLRESLRAAVDNAFTVLRSRVDRFGVAQPNIQKLEGGQGRVMVELPGVKNPDRVLNLLKGSTNLQFWETFNAEEIEVRILPALVSLDEKYMSAQNDTTVVPMLARMARVNMGSSSCVVGYFHKNDTAFVNEVLATEDAKRILPKELHLYWSIKPSSIEATGSYIELNAIKDVNRDGDAPLQGDVIAEAEAGFDEFGNPCVNMRMNAKDAHTWANLTGANVNRAVAIVLDNYVYSAPNVEGKISGGNCKISGNFTIEATQDLANVLCSGKMLAPMNVVDAQIVGPSLGEESIQQGLVSFVVAFIILMIYMCAIYGLIPGMVANMALLLNLFFTLGILASFQAALTLSGIAGIVLTLGMAVDANVLIYERSKEELRAGKAVRAALSDGYKNAFSAIFDSNFTSIITGIILFNFGTGPIKGFATTLIIGLLCSFFTAVFVTRVVFEHFLGKNKWQNLTFTTKFSKNLMRESHYNFMGVAKKTGIAFAVVIVVMVVSLFVRGLSPSIDFTGGRNFVIQFEQPVSAEKVRALLQEQITDDNVQAISYGTDGKTVRVSTNYMINDTARAADEQIEQFLYTAFMKGGLLSEGLDISDFRDRAPENRDGGSIIGSQKVGPSIAKDIRDGAVISVVLALIAIFLYILVRFRNVAYSIGSLLALAVDVTMIIGCYSLLHGVLPMSLEIDQTFIGAILTAIGYSINDKVVIFDRIREFSYLYPKRNKFDLFNTSLNTTLARTINTSFSTLIVLLCIFFLGGDSIRSFSFAMILGVVFGTLSSLFIAAPIAYRIINRKAK